MQVPIENSGAVVAGIFILAGFISLTLACAFCVIADEWRKAGFNEDDYK